METMQLFKTVLLVQLFYAFAITLLAYTIPSGAQGYVTGFSDVGEQINLQGVSEDVQDSLEQQTNIPLIELGALVFYSGNILIDLILNFAFAIPQMLGMLVNGIMFLFNVDTYIWAVVQLFASVVVTVMYLLGVISMLVNIRSGRSIQ